MRLGLENTKVGNIRLQGPFKSYISWTDLFLNYDSVANLSSSKWPVPAIVYFQGSWVQFPAPSMTNVVNYSLQ